MQKSISVIIGIIIVLIGGYAIFGILKNSEAGPLKAFAQCLNDKEYKVYGAYWCPVCKKQQELFGKSWKKINYVECSRQDRSQTKECQDEKIESYPTWEFPDKTKQSGLLSLEELSNKSGCQLPQEPQEDEKTPE